MQALALDVGEKRIGIAGTDALGMTAQPLETLRSTTPERDCAHIAQLARERNAQVIIVGLPLNMDGTRGFQAERVIAFAKELKAVCPLPILWIDERLTSRAAHRTLIEADMRRSRRKGVVDRIAAVYILETYLGAPSQGKKLEG